MNALGLVARIVLTAVTFLFLASMGGGMLFAAPVLVPLHWAAVCRSGPLGTAWFSLLAAASIAEVAWMVAYVLTGNEPLTAAIGIVALVATAAGFVVARSRAAARPRGATAWS